MTKFHKVALNWNTCTSNGDYVVSEAETNSFKDEARRNFPEIGEKAGITIPKNFEYNETDAVPFYVEMYPEDEIRESLLPGGSCVESGVFYFHEYVVYPDNTMASVD